MKIKKAEGLEPEVLHKESVTSGDRERLTKYVIEANDPIKQLMFAWYWITLYFGLRAREVQVQLNESDLVFNEDKDGEFITLGTDFQSKNCQGRAAGREFSTVGRIDNVRQVARIKLFLQKLHPEIDRLFQRARTGMLRADDKIGSCVKSSDITFWAK